MFNDGVNGLVVEQRNTEAITDAIGRIANMSTDALHTMRMASLQIASNDFNAKVSARAISRLLLK